MLGDTLDQRGTVKVVKVVKCNERRHIKSHFFRCTCKQRQKC